MEADAYPDLSFLVSLHRADAHREEARSYLARMASSLAFTPLHRVEIRNAFRNAVAVGDMNRVDCRLAFEQFEEDLHDRNLIHTGVEWTNVFRLADDLSNQHSTTTAQRTIDLLHVAVAKDCGADAFLSFDRRQRRLAQVAGIKVLP